MFVRLAIPDDVEEIIAMAGANVAETMPGEPFSEARVLELLSDYFEESNPTFYVVDHFRDLIGFMMSRACKFDYRDGFYYTQSVIYVKPVNRGTRAAPLMLRHLIAESRRLKADAIMGGNDNGFQSDRTRRFLEHYGFRDVGYIMRRDPWEKAEAMTLPSRPVQTKMHAKPASPLAPRKSTTSSPETTAPEL